MAAKRFKDFGSEEPSKEEPPTFDLYGEHFECVPEVQGALMLRLVQDSQDPDPAVSASIILAFFDHVLTDESNERFKALINSKDKIVRIEKLGDITGWLMEEYSERPEEQPEAS